MKLSMREACETIALLKRVRTAAGQEDPARLADFHTVDELKRLPPWIVRGIEPIILTDKRNPKEKLCGGWVFEFQARPENPIEANWETCKLRFNLLAETAVDRMNQNLRINRFFACIEHLAAEWITWLESILPSLLPTGTTAATAAGKTIAPPTSTANQRKPRNTYDNRLICYLKSEWPKFYTKAKKFRNRATWASFYRIHKPALASKNLYAPDANYLAAAWESTRKKVFGRKFAG